jgi:hypothetical protein
MDSRDQEKHEIERNGGQREDGVGPIPADVMKAVEEDIEAAGGEYEEAPEYEGAIGRTMFDTPYSEDGTVTVLMPKENIEDVPRQSLVRKRASKMNAPTWELWPRGRSQSQTACEPILRYSFR